MQKYVYPRGEDIFAEEAEVYKALVLYQCRNEDLCYIGGGM